MFVQSYVGLCLGNQIFTGRLTHLTVVKLNHIVQNEF